MTTLKDISATQNVAFGTSGVRALVDDLTHDMCYHFTNAFITQVVPEATRIAIAIDLRPSSKQIALSMSQAAQDCGLEVLSCGAIPTPALAYFGLQNSMPTIMVTGSHIPFDRNGFKFYTATGEISKQEEAAILSYKPEEQPTPFGSSDMPEANDDAKTEFLARYLKLFDRNALDGLRIGIYEHSSVARDMLTELLGQLGADVISLGRTDHFVPIDTEAVSEEDQTKAFEWSSRYKLDAIISTDGDGDRPLLADETGLWLRGDVLGILVSQLLNATHVACPVNVNTALEAGSEITALRTRIGSPYVIEGMEHLANESDANVVGFEANGGFLVGNRLSIGDKYIEPLPTRDSFLPIIAVLVASISQGVAISQLVNELPQRYTASDRIKDVPTAFSQAYIAELKTNEDLKSKFLKVVQGEEVDIISVDETDGLRLSLSNGAIVHLRPSGNAPELRCYAEADTYAGALEIVKRVLHYISKQVPSSVA